ncbi:MAG: peptidoglycan DD-metalloendopeptidase family protein [Actinomycetota bacterium]|nr:peptidoglycan DD-metalloendopeptidase family protein [Actinomycetota bacterium]
MRTGSIRSTPHSWGRLRRAGGVALAVVLLAALTSNGAQASTKSDLEHAKARLGELEKQITAERAQLEDQHQLLQSLQGSLNELAGRIDAAQTRYDQTQNEIMTMRQELAQAQRRYQRLRSWLDDRARYAYENGPAGDIEFILGSSSLTDLSDRVEFIGRLSQNDADLANQVQNRSNDLQAKRGKLEGLLADQASSLDELGAAQSALDGKFAEQKSLYDKQAALVADLNQKAAEVDDLVAKLKHKLAAEELAAAQAAAAGGGLPLPNGQGPFQYCPVQGSHAYADSFGEPRYTGGYHPHAGVDIFAPEGTPIVAPFDGVAEQDPNGLGGNAVIVRGSQGWVYNAHLSSYGNTGSVSAGEIVGYVGNSGDAAGGATHDHFEWHPNVIPSNPYRSQFGYTVIGTAIDPYPYLNLVC